MSKPVIDEYGNELWYNSDGKLHREDGHAAEFWYGTKEWWLNGKHHREDGPAIEFTDGYKEWWLNDKLVYSDSENNTDQFEISKEMKRSIIKYKLSNIST
jgi:hypothetical protein